MKRPDEVFSNSEQILILNKIPAVQSPVTLQPSDNDSSYNELSNSLFPDLYCVFTYFISIFLKGKSHFSQISLFFLQCLINAFFDNFLQTVCKT